MSRNCVRGEIRAKDEIWFHWFCFRGSIWAAHPRNITSDPQHRDDSFDVLPAWLKNAAFCSTFSVYWVSEVGLLTLIAKKERLNRLLDLKSRWNKHESINIYPTAVHCSAILRPLDLCLICFPLTTTYYIRDKTTNNVVSAGFTELNPRLVKSLCKWTPILQSYSAKVLKHDGKAAGKSWIIYYYITFLSVQQYLNVT